MLNVLAFLRRKPAPVKVDPTLGTPATVELTRLSADDSVWANALLTEITQQLVDRAGGDRKRLHLLRRRIFVRLS